MNPLLRALLEDQNDPAPSVPEGMDDPFAQNNQEQNDNTNQNDVQTDPFAQADSDNMQADQNNPDANMDLNNNPDGLPSPDAQGDTSITNVSDEKNLQVKIIKASKLERSLLKIKILHKFQDLRNKIDVFSGTMDKNMQILPHKERNNAFDHLQLLSNKLDEYIEYKFSMNNYESNLQAYIVFIKKFNEIVDFISGSVQQDNK